MEHVDFGQGAVMRCKSYYLAKQTDSLRPPYYIQNILVKTGTSHPNELVKFGIPDFALIIITALLGRTGLCAGH